MVDRNKAPYKCYVYPIICLYYAEDYFNIWINKKLLANCQEKTYFTYEWMCLKIDKTIELLHKSCNYSRFSIFN